MACLILWLLPAVSMAAEWQVSGFAGSGCSVSADRKCITSSNYPDNYAAAVGLGCNFWPSGRSTLWVGDFQTNGIPNDRMEIGSPARGFFWENVGGEHVLQNILGPNGIQVDTSYTFRWFPGSGGQKGWRLCLSEEPLSKNCESKTCGYGPPFRTPEEFARSSYVFFMISNYWKENLANLLQRDDDMQKTLKKVCPLHCDTASSDQECEQFPNQFTELGKSREYAGTIKNQDGLALYAYTAMWGCGQEKCPLTGVTEWKEHPDDDYFYSADLLEDYDQQCAETVRNFEPGSDYDFSCAHIQAYYKTLNLYLRRDCTQQIQEWTPLLWRTVEEIRTRPYRPGYAGHPVYLYRNDNAPKVPFQTGQIIQYPFFMSTSWDRCYPLKAFAKDDAYFVAIRIPDDMARRGVFGMRDVTKVSFYGDREKEVLVEPYYQFKVVALQEDTENCPGDMQVFMKEDDECVRGVLLEAVGVPPGLPLSSTSPQNLDATEGYNGPLETTCPDQRRLLI